MVGLGLVTSSPHAQVQEELELISLRSTKKQESLDERLSPPKQQQQQQEQEQEQEQEQKQERSCGCGKENQRNNAGLEAQVQPKSPSQGSSAGKQAAGRDCDTLQAKKQKLDRPAELNPV